jgi:hypothetical protein
MSRENQVREIISALAAEAAVQLEAGGYRTLGQLLPGENPFVVLAAFIEHSRNVTTHICALPGCDRSLRNPKANWRSNADRVAGQRIATPGVVRGEAQ